MGINQKGNIMGRSFRLRPLAGAALIAIGAAVSVGGVGASAPHPATVHAVGSADSSTPSAEYQAALEQLIDAAVAEGSLTFYTSQGLDQANALGAAFTAEYGIPVEVIRGTDGDLIPRLETEMGTGTHGADLAVMAALGWIQAQAEAGAFLDPSASPEVAGLGAYDAEQFVHDGNIFEVGAAVLTMGWNTDLWPAGLTDYPDLLDPELAGGKIGVIDPAGGPAIVDFWRWVEETYGEDFVVQLAAQEPMIYGSSLPIGEALASGEIYASPYAAPVTLIPAQANGAPVQYGIGSAGAWGARYFAMIPSSAEHPAAAALFANFMLTPLGQQLVQGASGSVLPDIPGTLITNDMVRVMDLAGMAPEPVAEYIAKWDELFR